MSNIRVVKLPIKEIVYRLHNMRPNDFMTWLKENEERLLYNETQYSAADQKRLKATVELCFSMGYDAGYENGLNAAKRKELPQTQH